MGWQSDSRPNLPVEPLQQQHNNQPWSVGDIGRMINMYEIMIYLTVLCDIMMIYVVPDALGAVIADKLTFWSRIDTVLLRQ